MVTYSRSLLNQHSPSILIISTTIYERLRKGRKCDERLRGEWERTSDEHAGSHIRVKRSRRSDCAAREDALQFRMYIR